MAGDSQRLIDPEALCSRGEFGGNFRTARIAAKWVSVAVAAACLCAAAALVTVSLRRAGRVAAPAGPATQAITVLEGVSAACSAYTDCAALDGNCCPNDAGVTLGCCNSPVLSASASEACMDTPSWTNGYEKCSEHGFNSSQGCTEVGVTCMGYEALGFCASGSVVVGKEWTVGPQFNSPELNCCACGKADNPPGAPPMNNTQGEPSQADCSAHPDCASIGISGHCCPTDDGTNLGCCASLEASGGAPQLLPPADSPGPLMTFYMYRVANDENYPVNGVNMANLAGDMWYLHNEVVQNCPRKFNMERLLRFKVTMRATPELYGQNSRKFDSFVAMDQAKCTVPKCTELHWDPYGYVVGCQPNNVVTVAVPGAPVWYSLPGTCPSKFYYEKTAACNAEQPGGACPTSDVTGTRNCTYFLERAGEIRLDELSGIQNYNEVCEQTGQREYDVFTDRGHGSDFWDGKQDAKAGEQRMKRINDLFLEKFPQQEYSLDDPLCE